MATPSREGQLILALEAIKRNQNLSTRTAATIYNVPESTLRSRKKGITSRRDSPPNSKKLIELEEKTIVQYVLDLDSRCQSPRLSGVEDMANYLLRDRGARRVGPRWVSNFVKRQPELRTRQFRRYDYKRAKSEDPDAINAWFRLMRNIVAKYGIAEADIFNFDETGFMIGVITSGMIVTTSESRSRKKKKQPGNREWVTVI